jgi:hypothetical protein
MNAECIPIKALHTKVLQILQLKYVEPSVIDFYSIVGSSGFNSAAQLMLERQVEDIWEVGVSPNSKWKGEEEKSGEISYLLYLFINLQSH